MDVRRSRNNLWAWGVGGATVILLALFSAYAAGWFDGVTADLTEMPLVTAPVE